MRGSKRRKEYVFLIYKLIYLRTECPKVLPYGLIQSTMCRLLQIAAEQRL